MWTQYNANYKGKKGKRISLGSNFSITRNLPWSSGALTCQRAAIQTVCIEVRKSLPCSPQYP